jgi:mannose-6-phosphate isomerase-like protein (cupin superfamily)
MVYRRNEMKTEVKEKLRDGEGSVHFTHFASPGTEKNCRMLAELTLEPGCSIGYHQHDRECEYFIILSGTGLVNDNGKELPVKAGDMVATGNGASHSIKNTGSVPPAFHGIIVTY